ncbi:MAG: cation diffusion facilitator family transporter [Candidatus Gastranaerophilales bacterium]|nr:cation diffusion facilitator family transporter [Candidatus Gastranaerophilales bacterium]
MSPDPNEPSIDPRHKIELKTGNLDGKSLQTIYKTRAIIRALVANLGIAFIKLLCWFLSNSSAMLSEAIHSSLDSFNSFCLLIGIKRGSRPADSEHPFGYGLEANIWALFASLLMLVGAFASMHSGFDKFFHSQNGIHDLLNNYHFIAVALIGSIIFEAWAVKSAIGAVLQEMDVSANNGFSAFWKSAQLINKVKSPTTKFVWFEDTFALAGVIVAFVAITIAKFAVPVHYAYIPDAVASVIIGFMLLFLAFYLLKNNINFLTGTAAGPQIEKMIKEITNNVHGVASIHELKTMDMGASGLLVNLEIEVKPDIQVKDADDIADRVEYLIRSKIKNIADVTIEMVANDLEDNWEDKFMQVIEEGKKLDILTKEESKILKRFFDFTDTVAMEIMVPRTQVVFADINDSVDDVVETIISSGHTRIPVYRDNIDNVVGIINAKDVLKVVKNNCGANPKIEPLVREIHVIPETKPISELLTEFTSTKSQFAVIADEHGGVAGIITIEDILEVLVGEIYDEFDKVQEVEYHKIDKNTIKFDATMDIEDINEKFDLDLSTEDYQTIGGYVFGLLGREAEVGDVIEEGNLEFVVEEVSGHKIEKLKVIKKDGFVEIKKD